MIIRRVKLHNFGIYADTVSFDLEPVNDSQYTRPIVLFRDKMALVKVRLWRQFASVCMANWHWGHVLPSASTIVI